MLTTTSNVIYQKKNSHYDSTEENDFHYIDHNMQRHLPEEKRFLLRFKRRKLLSLYWSQYATPFTRRKRFSLRLNRRK
jgi:hypothetical protein